MARTGQAKWGQSLGHTGGWEENKETRGRREFRFQVGCVCVSENTDNNHLDKLAFGEISTSGKSKAGKGTQTSSPA